MNRIPRIVFLGIFLLFLTTGCASVISKQVLDSVDRSITFQNIKADPDRFIGKTVLMGGQIVATTVKKDETWIEIIQKPLDWNNRPENTDQSYGRFLVLFQGFMDPAIYAAGREITVAGEIKGKRTLPLDTIEYTYPVLTPKEHHVWKPEETSRGLPISIGIGVGGIIR